MPSRAERFRREMIKTPLANHSGNQRRIKFMREGEQRVFGRRNKATRAERRRNDFSNNFSRAQFERSLRNVFNGGATLENIAHAMQQIKKFEEPVEVVEGVEITIINLSKE